MKKLFTYWHIFFTLFVLNSAKGIPFSPFQQLILQKDSASTIEDRIYAFHFLIDYYIHYDLIQADCLLTEAQMLATEMDDNISSIRLHLKRSMYYFLSGKLSLYNNSIDSVFKAIEKSESDLLYGYYWQTRSFISNVKDDYSNSIVEGYKAIEYFRKVDNTIELARCYNYIAIIYSKFGNHQNALRYLYAAQSMLEQKSHMVLEGSVVNNLGMIYEEMNQPDTALEFYYKSLELRHKFGDDQGSVVSFNNIAGIFVIQERFDEALSFYHKAKSIAQGDRNPVDFVVVLRNLSFYWNNLNRLDSAEYYLLEAVKVDTALKNPSSFLSDYLMLADLYMQKGSIKQAGKYLSIAKGIEKQIDSPVLLRDLYAILSDYHQKLQQFDLALNYQKKVVQYSDTLINEYNSNLQHYAQLLEQNSLAGQHLMDTLSMVEQKYDGKISKQRTGVNIMVVLVIVMLLILALFSWGFIKLRSISANLEKEVKRNKDQRELLEISNEELREQYLFGNTLLDTIPNPVFYTDTNNVILGANKAFCELCDESESKLIGKKLVSLLKKSLEWCKWEPGQHFNNLIKKEGTLLTKQNENREVICYRRPIRTEHHKSSAVLGIIIDISEIKLFERSLKSSEAELKSALNAKSKFFNLMAHDLRSPFNAILGLTELLNENYNSFTSNEIQEYLKMVNESAGRVFNLLENLLNWSRAQTGMIEVSKSVFPIQESVTDCLKLFSHQITTKNISMQVMLEDIHVKADRNMVSTVLRNIMSNAIKFTPTGGIISISHRVHKNLLWVTISDSGIGIPEHHLSSLFNMDKPISTVGLNNEKGTGLGLILSKEFIERNGGSISVQSKPNKGTTVSFSIPAYQLQHA